MKSEKNLGHPAKGSSKAFKLFGYIPNSDNLRENYLVNRIHELEANVALLENKVEAGSTELSRVIASNAKYLSIVAHDLRSPFASILAVLSVLKEGLNQLKIEESSEYIDMASASASRTLNLLDDLLPWAISQSKVVIINPVKINLLDLFNAVIDNFKIQAKQKQIFLHHSIAPELCITADLQMVNTILRNLIGNAIKFTCTGGKITLSATERKSFVEIVVRDTGIGMSGERQAMLFKSDTVTSTDGTNNEHGTGLGLRLCKEFVDLHGGKIWIESQLGKGSEFKFTMPHYI